MTKKGVHRINVDHWTFQKLDDLESKTGMAKGHMLAVFAQMATPKKVLEWNIKVLSEGFKFKKEDSVEGSS
jgi:hypothetical protein